MLGAPAAVSRSLIYVNLSSVCSWATGAATRARRGQRLQQPAGGSVPRRPRSIRSRPRDVPGISGDAFTIPGAAYAIAPTTARRSRSRATFPPTVGPRTPLPVTPQLTALLASAVTLMQ